MLLLCLHLPLRLLLLLLLLQGPLQCSTPKQEQVGTTATTADCNML
jgi:hypothetical protein